MRRFFSSSDDLNIVGAIFATSLDVIYLFCFNEGTEYLGRLDDTSCFGCSDDGRCFERNDGAYCGCPDVEHCGRNECSLLGHVNGNVTNMIL